FDEGNNPPVRPPAEQLRQHICVEHGGTRAQDRKSSSDQSVNGTGRSSPREGNSISPRPERFSTSHLPRCGSSSRCVKRLYSSIEKTTQVSRAPMTCGSPARARSSTSESLALASCTVHMRRSLLSHILN